MRIALAQLNYRIGDFEGNAGKINASIEKAKELGADLVVFSELAVTGYYPHDLLEKKEFILKAEESIREIALHCRGIAALVGGPAINDGERGKQLFNAAYYLENGGIRDIFYKSLLPTYDIFDEYRHFEPNRRFHLLTTGNSKLAVTICEDLWDEQPVYSEFGKNKLYQTSPMSELAKLGPEIVINLSASPFSANQETWRKDILIRKARESGIPLVYVNQVGAHAELIYDGGSVFIDSGGRIVHELKYFEEDFRIIDTKCTNRTEVQPASEKIEKIHDALVLGIRDYFEKTGFKKATLGLSGGIDSAIVAALAVRALGSRNVRVLLLPSVYSSEHSVKDALLLAQNLDIEYDLVPIQESVDAVNKAMLPVFANLPPDVTEENIQARIRGIMVMALSNKLNHLVLNTSNKSECAVGYGTLYGDMNGGLSVLGDVYKTQVYQLAAYINRNSVIIPAGTISKPPSAELRPGQKDSDSLPEYDILDHILFRYIELNQSPAEIASSGPDRMLVDKVIRMVNMNEYKRFQAPPILRVSSKSFGFGRRMPLVARF
jgi:NAD+ synthase (glutamine-hydrolysing)